MNEHSGEAEWDGNPRRRLKVAAGETNQCQVVVVVLTSLSRRKTFSARSERVDAIRQDSNELNRERAVSRLSDFTSETGETLRCVRSGGPGPNASPVVTADRRAANERRCGGGERSPSCGWRGVVREMSAEGGSAHE